MPGVEVRAGRHLGAEAEMTYGLRVLVPGYIIMLIGGRSWPRRRSRRPAGRLPDDETASPSHSVKPPPRTVGHVTTPSRPFR